MFCTASWKESQQKQQSHALYTYKTCSFTPQSYKGWQEIYDSVVDIWYGNTQANIETVKKMPFHKSDIRPFGAWYEARIKIPTGREWKNVITHFGIFTVRRENIIRYSKTQWEEWFADIAKSGPLLGIFLGFIVELDREEAAEKELFFACVGMTKN